VKKTMLAIQIAFGFVLCGIILWAWLYYLPLPEVHYPDGSQPIGWHSAVAALGVAVASQYLSRLIFRKLGH
jgi:hypothetical protein